MSTIERSVGKHGVNRRGDVEVVQKLINNHIESIKPIQKLAPDGAVGRKTIGAIKAFQKDVVGFRWPDGRVDPDGRTFKALNGVATGGPVKPRASGALGVSRLYYQHKKLRWSFHGISPLNPYLEVDIKPEFAKDDEVTRLLFTNGTLPDGVTLSSTLRVDSERWKLEWKPGKQYIVMGSLRRPFSSYLISPNHIYHRVAVKT